MGTHLIPREIDGDGRILIIFTLPGFVGTLCGILVGTIFFKIAEAMKATLVGWVLLALFALIGFVVGQVRIPDSNSFPLFKKIGGLTVREAIVKFFAFKKKEKIYVYEKTNYKRGADKEPESMDESIMLSGKK